MKIKHVHNFGMDWTSLAVHVTKELTALAPSTMKIKYPLSIRALPGVRPPALQSLPCMVISLRGHPVVHVPHILLLCLLHDAFGHWKESISIWRSIRVGVYGRFAFGFHATQFNRVFCFRGRQHFFMFGREGAHC